MAGPLQTLRLKLSPSVTGHGPDAAREALWLAVGLVALLAVTKPVLDGVLGLAGAAFTLAAAYQLYLPLGRLEARREDPADYGIHAHGLIGVPLRALRALVGRLGRALGFRGAARAVTGWLWHYTRPARLDLRGAARDLAFATLACVLTFPPFAVGYVLFQRFLAERQGRSVEFALRAPDDVLALAATHIFLVAIPEELFYRGYIHTLLVRAWPPRFTVLGASVGKAVLVGSALFALGHFAGEWNPQRLGPFFPALLFCALRSVSGSIMGAVLYHGLSNVMGEVMRVSTTWH
ncbi:MAG: CPBP family intramembrane glutamic endopeptidase [Myxococcota bacterium]